MSRLGATILTAILLLGLFSAAEPAPAYTPNDEIPSATRKSIDKGFRYLLAAQNTDGSWGDNKGEAGDLSNTAIGALALMARGDTLTSGESCQELRRAVSWSFDKVRKSGGRIGSNASHTLLHRKLGPNIDVYLTAILYSQVLGLELEEWEAKEMQDHLRKLVDHIASLQKANGEFETSYEPMLTTVCAWLALRSAHDAGVSIRSASAQKVVDYLMKESLDPANGIFRDKKWGMRMRFVSQAGGLRVISGMGMTERPDIRKAIDVIHGMKWDQDVGGRSGGEEYLGALFAAQALHIDEGADFRKFYPVISNALIKCQNADGSWYGHHCITGRVFCTACSVMVMMTPNKLLPMLDR